MGKVDIDINIREEIAAGRMKDFTNDVGGGLEYIAEKAKMSLNKLSDLEVAVQKSIKSGLTFAEALHKVSVNTDKWTSDVRQAAREILNFTAGNEAFIESLRKQKNTVEEDIVPAWKKYTDLLSTEGIGAIKGFITGSLGLAVIGGIGLQLGRDFAKGFSDIAFGAANASRQINQLITTTGMSARETQIFSQIAEYAGENVSHFATMMQTLSLGLTENTGQGRNAQKALEDMGITYRDVTTGALMPMDQIFLAIVTKLEQMGPGAQATKDAIQALGRSGIHIESLGTNFTELHRIVEAINPVFSDEALKVGDKLRQQEFIFHESVQKFKVDVAEYVAAFELMLFPSLKLTSDAPIGYRPGKGGGLDNRPRITEKEAESGSKVRADIVENNRLVDIAMNNANDKLAEAEEKLKTLREGLKRDVLPSVNSPILTQIEAQKKLIEKIKKDAVAGPLDRSLEVQDQNEASHLEHRMNMARTGVETMIEQDRALEENRIRSIDNVYARNIAAAELEVHLAEAKQTSIAAIYKAAENAEIAALQKKEADIPKGSKTRAAEIERIEGEKQAVLDKYEERGLILKQNIEHAKTNAARVTAEETRKFQDAFSKQAEIDAAAMDRLDDASAASDARIAVIEEQTAQKHADALEKIEEQTLKQKLDLMQINEAQYLKMVQESEEKAYQIKMKAIADERAALSSNPNFTDKNKFNERSAQLNSQESGIIDQHKIASAVNATARLKHEIQQVGQFIKPISHEFSTAISSWVTGSKTFGQAFVGMTRGILTSWIDTLVGMGVQWAERHAIMWILHEAFNLGLVASDVKKDATIIAADAVADKARATLDISTAAAIGAANALAWWSGVLPPIAPAMAAATYGEIMSFNALSAAQGADLPNYNTFGFLHPREMVLPAKYADVIRGMGSNTSNRSVNVGSINYNSRNKASSREFTTMARDAMRNMNI